MPETSPLLVNSSGNHNSVRRNGGERAVAFYLNFKRITYLTVSSNPVNYLLVLVPLGLLSETLGFSSTWIFSFNFFSIIALASVLAYATEELADNVGQTIGGLLNATFGNAVELIVSIIAIKQNQIRVVQASMLGSILSNLLLVLGCCFVVGGYNRVQQTFNQTVAQTMSSLLALSVIGLLLPAAFHASLPNPDLKEPRNEFPVPGTSDDLVLSLSRGTSIILLIVYVLYLLFQLKTHKQLFESADEQMNNDVATENGLPLSGLSEIQQQRLKDEHAQMHLSPVAAVTVLIVTTVMVSFCADYLVSSIDDIVETSGLSKTFIGLIIIPIVGNAAEHVTAVVVAYKDKMDLAIGVAVGSSLQISLFVTPFMVLIGWIFDTPMSLYFSTFETAVMFVAVFITNYLILDGESNWLEGAMLLSTYLIIAISFFYYPDTVAT
ncbi:hypothetical protein PACTADRAFT_2462 [Pachysolen tannophilus NRRL Y-2460]|uniref:Vacuolar calcium ion transporter n=1 Tax=Pachysolen tannophilus NRRL Y-2460 TaxID=669874 RepID=A0A1E4TWR5_PACTA|nr:hypothetical protein PACTADRAFT_2462 [Pachysolen tannophilus NRRL Y-2460]